MARDFCRLLVVLALAFHTAVADVNVHTEEYGTLQRRLVPLNESSDQYVSVRSP